MMNASAMMAMIRKKKKDMERDHSDAVKLSGIPMDATDIEQLKMREATDHLDENEPKEHNEEPGLMEELSQEKAMEPHEEEAPNPKQINQPEDGAKEMRKAKIRKFMARYASDKS